MSLSVLLEKNLKAQIIRILISGTTRTAEQLFAEIKKRGVTCTKRGVYKALSELVQKKVIIKYSTNYEMNAEWIAELGTDANKALRKLLEKNLLGVQVKDLHHQCACNHGVAEGFCSLCYELTCPHCSIKSFKHILCHSTCMNCRYCYSEDVCIRCNEKSCKSCSKELWVHEHSFCNKKNNEANVAILEVDHECWFSNTSERYPEDILLSNFSDRLDKKRGTHSGVIKIEAKDKNKLLGRVLKQGLIREARLIHKTKDAYYVKTRADINKSVDEFTKKNKSELLNPIIARDSKEQNLILSLSQQEMRALSKGLQEFGGKVKLVSLEQFNVNKMDQIKNKKIREFLAKVPKKELLDSLQKVRLRGLFE